MNAKIVCAAIRADDGSVLVGIRHYSGDMHSQLMVRNDAEKFKNRSGKDQGFVDQFGKYYTREEAFDIAEANGQIFQKIHDAKRRLYSEHLY